MDLKLAFVGFGNVARDFARILTERRALLADRYAINWRATAIATARHGSITSAEGIDLIEASERIERGEKLSGIRDSTEKESTLDLVDSCDADVLFETTPLNADTGEPAITIIRRVLARSINVVSANKGPVAFAYRELQELARLRGVSFRFEGTVMDGAPVFNLIERCLPATKVKGFAGVLNSTTNLILTGMESGRSLDSSLAEAKRLGIVEANADYDLDGWDAAVKTVALANVLMSSDVRPQAVERRGIREITEADVALAAQTGNVIRLVSRARVTDCGLKLSAMPERIPLASLLGSARGTTNVLMIETDLMGEIAVFEHEPGVRQTAYALLSDFISIHQAATGSN